MPIPITIELTADVKNLKIYDYFGSNYPVEGNGYDYSSGTNFNFYTSNLPKCCNGPAEGCIQIFGKVEDSSGTWAEENSIISVVDGGEYQWP